MSSELNGSGELPVDNIVIVKPEKVEDKKGSIFLPDQHVDRQQAAAERGQLVAVGPSAFFDWNQRYIPQVGDWVRFGRYKQVMFDGADGDKYWFLKDEDLLSVGAESATAEALRGWAEDGGVPQERAA